MATATGTSETSVFANRLERTRAQMRAKGMDYLIIGPSADLLYMLGMHARQTERMTLMVISQEGPAHIVLPGFEAALLPPLPTDVQVHTWGESDNPSRLAAQLMAQGIHSHPGGAHCTVGVSDRLWAAFLISIQAEMPRASFTSGAGVLSSLRMVKDELEIEYLAASGAAADRVFAAITAQRLSGRRELEVAAEITRLLELEGLVVEGAPIVASGPNSASPHHHSGERVIEPGDMVVLDFGGTWHGYYSDITRTVFVGSPPAPGSEQLLVYNLVAEAQALASASARPAMEAQALDSTARDYLTKGGYGEFFTHRLGHGIGLDGHEPPYIVQGNELLLRAGMTFSIEPGLYLPGKFGVRIEDIVVLEENGARSFNNANRGVVVVS